MEKHVNNLCDTAPLALPSASRRTKTPNEDNGSTAGYSMDLVANDS